MYGEEALVLLDQGLIDPCDTRTAIYPLDPSLKEVAQSAPIVPQPNCLTFPSLLEGSEEKLDPQLPRTGSTQ